MKPPRLSTPRRAQCALRAVAGLGSRRPPDRWWPPASDAFEDDDGDLARRPLLILVVGRPDRGHRLPESRLLGRRRRAGARLEAICQDLDLNDRIRDEIFVPARMLGRAPARGHDEVLLA